ncbi:ComEC/Rec2 family competence protein [Jannaschia sp. CCS1]|uniref:ComEC/Rec2 family competence protein n=1 Tax=Jannaschia sp. (strain CCS1) TaxID=290400 RepID=UPI000053A8F9|nr:ComEC/Rec2 family competence protein [Jannaschia sp. CCS1]ABD54760.1 ComEC/Rec2-related protein [Jannaschia sp. CCS1]
MILRAANAVQQGQRGALMPWTAVALGCGVGLYFSLSVEPGVLAYGAAIGVAILAAAIGFWRREVLGPLGLAVVLVAVGFCLAGLRAHSVAGPVIDFRYYGAIEGRIVGIDRSSSDAVRLTLDQVRLDDVRNTPLRVRIALHGDQGFMDPQPGAIIFTTGHLSPPGGAAEPGGFDFQRHAWFQSIGGVGYTRTPVLLLEPPADGVAPLFTLRMRMSAAVQAQIPGQPGAFAAAVLTGDRSGLSQGSTQDMRDSNIAHLLAISGLHMGLLTGFVYAALRTALALIPAIALRYPIRKWAAVAALVSGAFYLALSGGNVATERAFIQVAVMFTAVLLDRRAITLRSVAIAAIIVLLHRPETLMSPGFQMSFAATTALVAAFTGLQGAEWMRNWPKWVKGAWALLTSSVIAGAATAPFAAAHFNRLAVYGLIANLLTVPAMGSVVIPFAVLALMLAPFGLSWVAFWIMELALEWILAVAARVADIPGAVRMVASPPHLVLPLIGVGGIALCIWSGRGRWIALTPMAAGLILWQWAERPMLLISEPGGLVGLTTDQGRALSRPRGDGFVAGIWLENDGDLITQEDAAARPAWADADPGRTTQLGEVTLWHGTGRAASRVVDAACARHDIVVTNLAPEDPSATLTQAERDTRARLTAPPPATGAANAATATPCLLLTPRVLSATGSIALSAQDGALQIDTARAHQGTRLWSRD